MMRGTNSSVQQRMGSLPAISPLYYYFLCNTVLMDIQHGMTYADLWERLLQSMMTLLHTSPQRLRSIWRSHVLQLACTSSAIRELLHLTT